MYFFLPQLFQWVYNTHTEQGGLLISSLFLVAAADMADGVHARHSCMLTNPPGAKPYISIHSFISPFTYHNMHHYQFVHPVYCNNINLNLSDPYLLAFNRKTLCRYALCLFYVYNALGVSICFFFNVRKGTQEAPRLICENTYSLKN